MQHSVAQCHSTKLERKYFGPFRVVDRVGPVSYDLALPTRSGIHDVFHVSLLKHAHGSDQFQESFLTDLLGFEDESVQQGGNDDMPPRLPLKRARRSAGQYADFV